jgi:hypothetical protein
VAPLLRRHGLDRAASAMRAPAPAGASSGAGQAFPAGAVAARTGAAAQADAEPVAPSGEQLSLL